MFTSQIEYFLALCEYKNYSETARRLYVSQSTISKQIDQLEKNLGFKLFERTTNSLRLTMQGAIMKKAYSDAIASITEAKKDASNYSKQIADTIHIGILEDSDIAFSLAGPINEMISHFKNSIDIQVSFLPYKDLNTGLHNNQIDIALTLHNEVENRPALKYTRLRSIPMGIVAHCNLNLVKDNLLNYDAIADLPFYYTTEGSLGVKKFLKLQQEHLEIAPQNYRPVPNILSMLMNVELQQGFAIALHTPQIKKNTDLIFYPLEGMTATVVAAWNRSNENPSRERIIKRIRHIIIEKGQF